MLANASARHLAKVLRIWFFGNTLAKWRRGRRTAFPGRLLAGSCSRRPGKAVLRQMAKVLRFS